MTGRVAGEKLLDIDPDNEAALNNLGSAVADIGRYDEAVEIYRKLLAVNSEYLPAFNNLLFIFNFIDDRLA